MHEGTLDGSKVCIKRVKVYTQDGPQKAARVRHRCRRFPRPLSLTKPTDLLSRGHNVETLDTSEHRTPTRCHYHPLSAHFDLDVWRGPARIHREEPQRRSTQTRRRSPVTIIPCSLRHQLSDVAKGLHYLHSCSVIHGDLKGVCCRLTPVSSPH